MAEDEAKKPSLKRLKKERFSGGFASRISPLIKNATEVLQQHQDKLNKEFTDSVYEEMMNDPAVESAVDMIKSVILSEPLRIVPKISDKKDERYDKALEMAKFCETQIEKLRRPIEVILEEALDCIQYGSSLSELIFVNASVEGKPVLKLVDIKTRSRKKYGFVVDRGYNLIGAVNTESGEKDNFTGNINPPKEKIVERQKLMVLSFKSKNSDPRGMSLLRSAWNAYYIKSQIWVGFYNYLERFGNPSVAAILGDNAKDVQSIDADGEAEYEEDGSPKMISAIDDAYNSLAEWQGGSAAVFLNGTTIEYLEAKQDGQAYDLAIAILNKEIHLAILKSVRYLLESKHGSRADSQSATDASQTYIGKLRKIVARTFEKDVLYQMISLNFGEDVAEEFAPRASLTTLAREDFSQTASAIAQLFNSGFIHDSQIEGLDDMAGLPKRDIEAFLEEREDARQFERDNELERKKLFNPQISTSKSLDEEDED